jgi:hypothetical protein
MGGKLVGYGPPTIDFSISTQPESEEGLLGAAESALPNLKGFGNRDHLLNCLLRQSLDRKPDDSYYIIRGVTLLIIDKRLDDADELLRGAEERYREEGVELGQLTRELLNILRTRISHSPI